MEWSCVGGKEREWLCVGGINFASVSMILPFYFGIFPTM